MVRCSSTTRVMSSCFAAGAEASAGGISAQPAAAAPASMQKKKAAGGAAGETLVCLRPHVWHHQDLGLSYSDCSLTADIFMQYVHGKPQR